MELVPARNRFNKLLCSTIFPYTNVCVKFDIFIPIPESLHIWTIRAIPTYRVYRLYDYDYVI